MAKGLFLIGLDHGVEVGRIRLAKTTEEWAAVLAELEKLSMEDESGRGPDIELFLQKPGVRSRGQAVKNLMEKHFDEKPIFVKQETFWPGRALEVWKGTTVGARELYLQVQRSDGQPF